MASIPPHSTPVVDKPWDAQANIDRIADDAGADTLRKMYAWVDSSKKDTLKTSYKLPHHEVGSDGQPGAANINGVRNALSRLSQTQMPEGDRAGVKAHLDRHMSDYHANAAKAAEPIYGQEVAPSWQL